MNYFLEGEGGFITTAGSPGRSDNEIWDEDSINARSHFIESDWSPRNRAFWNGDHEEMMKLVRQEIERDNEMWTRNNPVNNPEDSC